MLTYGALGHKGLVAHQHAVLERFPVEVLGGCEVSHSHHLPVGVDELCLAVHHVGAFLGLRGDAGERVGGGKGIAGIQEDEVVAMGTVDGLVHGVVEALVGFAPHHSAWDISLLDELQRVVGRGTVDD